MAKRSMASKQVIMGVDIDDASPAELEEKLETFLRSDRSNHVVTANPEMLVAGRHNRALRDAMHAADLVVADGFGILAVSTFLGAPIHHRTTGMDLIASLRNLAQKHGLKIFLLGGREGQALRAAQQLSQRYDIATDSLEGGDIQKHDQTWTMSTEVIETIRRSAPDILLVALGHNKQEQWIRDHLPQLPSVRVAVGVGGAFAFLAGDLPRAPMFLRRVGLEWLFRLLLEPRKRLKRILTAVVAFPVLAVYDKIKGK